MDGGMGEFLMLPENCISLLKAAALSKDINRIQRAIDVVKLLSPESFLQNEQEMRKRVFYHRPFSVHWSGVYKVDTII